MLSIIIPTLNDAQNLAAMLVGINSLRKKFEIIVVDGGSTDNTAEVAIANGARLIASQAGRGTQLAHGANRAKGEWFLFLHSDTRPGHGWLPVVTRFINKPRNIFNVAYFIFKLDDNSNQARILEKLVMWRNKYFNIPYGDQGLLISKKFYYLLGGYRPIPIMEDIEIISRIKSSRLIQLPIVAVTSSRRYRKDGYLKRPTKNFFCLSLYYFGFPPSLLQKIYNS